MANNKDKISKRKINKIVRLNRNINSTTNELIDDLHSRTFGTVPSGDIEALDREFETLINKEIKTMNDRTEGDVSTFIEKLFDDSRRRDGSYMKDIASIFNATPAEMKNIITDAYRNKLIKRADIAEVTSQLNELREAIYITRDAIVASDVVDGHICRTLEITNTGSEDSNNYKSIIEKMEERFKLHSKIKNYIVTQTLEQGEYYDYIIPYSEVFSNLAKLKANSGGEFNGFESVTINVMESTIESCSDNVAGITRKKNIACEDLYNALSESCKADIDSRNCKDSAMSSLSHFLERVDVINEEIPIPILDEGVESLSMYSDLYMTEANDNSNSYKNRNTFNTINGIGDGNGVYGDKHNNKDAEFDDSKECYMKFIDSLHLIPIKIMTKTIGYYYIREKDLDAVSNSDYYIQYGPDKEQGLVHAIASKIVNSFDKKFLKDNEEFKSIIVEAIQYYNLNNKRVTFQYIPAEYIVPFKINEDEEGNGTSVVEPSLFYAKLYLILLLFKMTSIVSNSNDTKVHYLRTSGISKDVSSAVQEIARRMQSRQVNIADMFSYNTLVNKIGGGDIFLPLGRGSEKGIETEILSGQDVQINNELMEFLRSAYISATGVPAVIMNSINEADFAKNVELGNTRFQARVVSEQLDFNEGITEMYKRLMKYTTSIPEPVIESFRFSFQAPKHSGSQITGELISNFDTYYNLAISLVFDQKEVEDENGGSSELLRRFKQLLVMEKLPLINVERILELAKEARVTSIENKLRPDPDSDDNGDGSGEGSSDDSEPE